MRWLEYEIYCTEALYRFQCNKKDNLDAHFSTHSMPSLPESVATKRCPWNKSYRLRDTFKPTEDPLSAISSNKKAKYVFNSCSKCSSISPLLTDQNKESGTISWHFLPCLQNGTHTEFLSTDIYLSSSPPHQAPRKSDWLQVKFPSAIIHSKFTKADQTYNLFRRIGKEELFKNHTFRAQLVWEFHWDRCDITRFKPINMLNLNRQRKKFSKRINFYHITKVKMQFSKII